MPRRAQAALRSPYIRPPNPLHRVRRERGRILAMCPNAVNCRRIGLVVMSCAVLTAAPVRAYLFASGPPQRLDPAAWGSDHVGKAVPEFVTGDECLFCHREKVGTAWGVNRHNLTIRPFEDNSPARAALQE